LVAGALQCCFVAFRQQLQQLLPLLCTQKATQHIPRGATGGTPATRHAALLLLLLYGQLLPE
jgi:hypothetical protein